jgi:membrane fusion protein (multidrug efflux system)
MSAMFSRSLRSLSADGFGRSLGGLLCVMAILGAWGAWFLLARVALYAVADTARLEVDRAFHPVASPLAGRVVASRLVLGQEVQAGEVLVELDATAQRLLLEEERTRQAVLVPQLAALRKEIVAEEEARREERQAGRMALDKARAQYRAAETVARLSQVEAERMARLHAKKYIAELDLVRARAEEQKRQAAADALRLEISRLEQGQRTQESDRKARLERLRRELSQLEGQMAMAAATIERLGHEIETRRLRAAAAGRLAEAANVGIGAVVREGEKLGVIVPPGELRASAYFLPSAALGRLRPGQPARLRLDGFPWTQYGSVSATVASVGSEARDGRVRVELVVHPHPASPIPLQHGLPGTVEVEIEHVSPATLVLRAVGQLLAVPGTALASGSGQGGE